MAQKPIEQLSFEEALKELEAIVRGMESGQLELEKAMVDYTRGTALKDHCMHKLADAKLRVEQLTMQNGAPALTEFQT